MATALRAEQSILPRDTILIDGEWRSPLRAAHWKATHRSQSGYGREGARIAIEQLLRPKNVHPSL